MHRSSPGTRTGGKRVPKCSEGFISGGVKTFLGHEQEATNRRFKKVGRCFLDGGSGFRIRWWVGAF